MSYDIRQIMDKLPHRYPFLLVDRILSIDGLKLVAIKNVTFNEPFFNGHFPGFPIMPGVLIVEAMAQAGGFLVLQSLGESLDDRKFYFMTIDRARFRRPVHPGAMLRIPVKVLRHRGPVWRFEGQAYVGDELCAEAEYSAMLTEQTLNAMSAPPSGKV